MKSVVFHGVLAALGLTLAYSVWAHKDEPERAEESVTLFECTPDELRSVQLAGERQDVRLEVRGKGRERAYWFTTERKSPHGAPTKQAFVGGDESVKTYLDQLLPVSALRALGAVNAKQVEGFGLKGVKTKLTVRCADASRTFEVGGNVYGTGDRYVRVQGRPEVYIVAKALVDDLSGAEFRLMQRELHKFEPTDVASVRVRAAGREKQLVHLNRNDPQRAEWVDATARDRRNELYGNWLQRVRTLNVQKYLAAGAEPGSELENVTASPTEVLSLEYRDDDDVIGHLEMVRVEAQAPSYYARSEATRTWVTVPTSVAQQLEDDVRPVLGLPAIQRPTPPPSMTPPTTIPMPPGGSGAPPPPHPGMMPPGVMPHGRPVGPPPGAPGAVGMPPRPGMPPGPGAMPPRPGAPPIPGTPAPDVSKMPRPSKRPAETGSAPVTPPPRPPGPR